MNSVIPPRRLTIISGPPSSQGCNEGMNSRIGQYGSGQLSLVTDLAALRIAEGPYQRVFGPVFIDGHTVSILTTKSHGQYNYTQMGMANTINGNPSIPGSSLEPLLTHAVRLIGRVNMHLSRSRIRNRASQKNCMFILACSSGALLKSCSARFRVHSRHQADWPKGCFSFLTSCPAAFLPYPWQST